MFRTGKYRKETFKIDPVIGQSYGSWFELKNKRLTLSADLEGEQEFAFELDATEGGRPVLH